jgi:hypothetical protein
MSGLPRGAAAHQVAQLEHDRIGDAIEDAVAGTPAADKSCVEKDLQVFGDVGLIPVQVTHNLVHRHNSALKGLQDAEAARFREHLKSAGNQFDHFLVDHALGPVRCGEPAIIYYMIIQAYNRRDKPEILSSRGQNSWSRIIQPSRSSLRRPVFFL